MPRTRNQVKMHSRVDWTYFPPELISHILSFLSFDEIAQCRQVCRSFNDNGKYLLNKEAKRISKVLATITVVSEDIPEIFEDFMDGKLPPWEPIMTLMLRTEWEFILKFFSQLYDTYEAYKDSSCFVAGKVLDCAKAISYFNSSAGRVQLCDLIPQAGSHFCGVIIPLIRKRSLRPLPARAALSTPTATTTAAAGSTRKSRKGGAGNKRRRIGSRGAKAIKKQKMFTHFGACGMITMHFV